MPNYMRFGSHETKVIRDVHYWHEKAIQAYRAGDGPAVTNALCVLHGMWIAFDGTRHISRLITHACSLCVRLEQRLLQGPRSALT